MSAVNTANDLENAPVFRIDGGELYLLARDVYKLTFNDLSPFAGQPAAGIKLSDATVQLSKDADLANVAFVLAQPDLKLSLRRGGPNGSLRAISVFIKQDGSKARVVSLEKDKGMVLATLLDSPEKYGEYFAAQHCSPVKLPPVNLIQPRLPLEVLVFIFNLTDCYRRGYLTGMLANSLQPVEAVWEDEFVTVLEQELKSDDIRWLLPSLIRLVPGLAETALELKGEQLEMAQSMNFISRFAPSGDKRPAYIFGSSGKYMGMEFTFFWRNAVGFEVTAASPKGAEVESVGRYYLAPTDEANHLFKLLHGDNGAQFVHLALTGRQTAQEIQKLIETHLDMVGEGGPADEAAVSAQAGAKTACGACGAEVAPRALFCTNCGTKLN